MNKKKELIKNTIIIFFGKACTYLISFFLLPLYTGYLTTKQYGVVDLVQSYITLLVPLITIELEMGVFRYLIDARGKSKDTKEVMTNNFIILFVSLFIFTILYLVVTQFFLKFDYRFIILVTIVICTISGNFLQATRGFGRTLDYAISCIITGATTIISNIFLIVVCGLRADGMIISMAVANGLGALYLFFRLKFYKYWDFSMISKKLLKEIIVYSAPLIPNSISWWVISVSDRSIISWVLGASANGIYAISNKFPSLLSSIMAIFNMSWCESATLHIDSPDRDEFFSDVCNTVVKLFSALGIGLIACMPFIFPLLINHKYNDAFLYIPIIVIGVVCNVVVALYTSIYIARKLNKQAASTSVIGAIINIVVNVLLIKFIGLYAAAISTVISYLVMAIYRHIDLKKYMNIKYEQGLFIKTALMFTLVIALYYQRNMILNIISLAIACIYAYITNRKMLGSFLGEVIRKLKHNK